MIVCILGLSRVTDFFQLMYAFLLMACINTFGAAIDAIESQGLGHAPVEDYSTQLRRQSESKKHWLGGAYRQLQERKAGARLRRVMTERWGSKEDDGITLGDVGKAAGAVGLGALGMYGAGQGWMGKGPQNWMGGAKWGTPGTPIGRAKGAGAATALGRSAEAAATQSGEFQPGVTQGPRLPSGAFYSGDDPTSVPTPTITPRFDPNNPNRYLAPPAAP